MHPRLTRYPLLSEYKGTEGTCYKVRELINKSQDMIDKLMEAAR